MADLFGTRILGGDVLRQKLDMLAKSFPGVVKAAINESALNIQTGAKRLSPVDTGRLRSSITIESFNDGLAQRVGTRVNYAAYQEFGTVKMKAQPFLFPAAEAERHKFEDTIRLYVNMARLLQADSIQTGGSTPASSGLDFGEIIE